MSCAHSFGEWCSECIDGMVQQYNAERAENRKLLDALATAERHRCSGCGHRWEGELKGAELCGDCWRKAQPVVHGEADASREAAKRMSVRGPASVPIHRVKPPGSKVTIGELNAAYAEADALSAQLRVYEEALKKLESAIKWALGEEGEFGEEPPPLAGKYRQRFWWRTELRKRAALASPDPLPGATQGDRSC